MRVTLDNTEVYMNRDDLPAFSYGVSDPLDPSVVKGDTSTSFVLPGALVNRVAGPIALGEDTPLPKIIAFGEAGVDYVRAKCVPIESSVNGYRLEAISGNSSWIDKARKTKLKELDLGQSETITTALQMASWTDETLLLYFPLINYGQILVTDLSSDPLDPKYLRPALRVANILDTFFGPEGYEIRPQGKLQAIWRKLILPNTENIKVGSEYVEGNKLELENPNDASITINDRFPGGFPTAAPTPLPEGATFISDPGGNNTGTYYFTAPVDMEVDVYVELYVTATMGIFDTNTWWLVIFDTAFPTIPLYIQATDVFGPLGYMNIPGGVLATITMQAGQEIGVGLWAADVDTPATVHTCKVIYTPSQVEYQTGITIDIAATAPDLSVMDILKGLAGNRCLIFDTRDDEGVVNVSLYDDKFVPFQVEGIDMRDRQTFPITRLTPPKPRRILFKWKHDDQDEKMRVLDATHNEAGFGGHIHIVKGGLDEDSIVELPWAATAMEFVYEGSVFVPTMAEKDQTPSVAKYDWQPRLLIADGVASGAWTLEGEGLLAAYPKCYFYFPSEVDLGLVFGTETGTAGSFAGTIARFFSNYLYRADNSKMARALIRFFDDELIDLDMGVPRLLSDGLENHWMYLTDVKGKTFGDDAPTECELIQS